MFIVLHNISKITDKLHVQYLTELHNPIESQFFSSYSTSQPQLGQRIRTNYQDQSYRKIWRITAIATKATYILHTSKHTKLWSTTWLNCEMINFVTMQIGHLHIEQDVREWERVCVGEGRARGSSIHNHVMPNKIYIDHIKQMPTSVFLEVKLKHLSRTDNCP